MTIPAESARGGQQDLLFPALDDNTHPLGEKDRLGLFGQAINKDFYPRELRRKTCPSCNMGKLYFDARSSAWICDMKRCHSIHYKSEAEEMKIQECAEGDVPIDTLLVLKNDEIVDHTDPVADVMLELSKLIYCDGCGVQGAEWSKARAKWACRTCCRPMFGDLEFTRYFVGKLAILKAIALPFLEKRIIFYSKFNSMVEPRGPKIELYSQSYATRLTENRRSDGGENAQRARIAAESLLNTGTTRPFSQYAADWSQELDRMCVEHPNFEEVIEMNVRPSMAVLAAGGQVRAAPILIYGDPGVGKSYFAQQIAKILRSPFAKVDMASAQSRSSLTGSSAFWANTDPGRVFNTLIFGTGGTPATIDPILFLDEVDKVSADRYDPLGGLYSLLEVESAKQFEDESYPGLALNASFIRWILAANDSAKISAPIRSRCQEFLIPPLTDSQKEKTYSRIFSNVVLDCRIPHFDRCLRSSVLEGLLELSMREYKVACTVAVGRALCADRTMVEISDFASPCSFAPGRKRIGFLP